MVAYRLFVGQKVVQCPREILVVCLVNFTTVTCGKTVFTVRIAFVAVQIVVEVEVGTPLQTRQEGDFEIRTSRSIVGRVGIFVIDIISHGILGAPRCTIFSIIIHQVAILITAVSIGCRIPFINREDRRHRTEHPYRLIRRGTFAHTMRHAGVHTNLQPFVYLVVHIDAGSETLEFGDVEHTLIVQITTRDVVVRLIRLSAEVHVVFLTQTGFHQRTSPVAIVEQFGIRIHLAIQAHRHIDAIRVASPLTNQIRRSILGCIGLCIAVIHISII